MLEILTGPDPDHCRIATGTPASTIVLRGIGADELRARFAGAGRAPPWAGRKRTIQAAVDDGELEGAPGEVAEDSVFDLDDGQVALASDRPGRIRIDLDHGEPRFLLPQSLNLLLTQQWARQGCVPLHAAAVQVDNTGLLAVGRKGCGKSLLTTAALLAGGHVISDDWLLAGLDDAHRPCVDRLRDFLMLRDSAAAARLMDRLPWLQTRPAGTRPKRTVRIDDLPDAERTRFASGTTVDRMIILQRPPAGRGSVTMIRPAAPELLLSRLVESAMPALLGPTFPHERDQILTLFRRLVALVDSAVVETGTDLIDEPARTFRAMLKWRG